MTNSVLITGGTGFLGNRLVQSCIAAGREVFVLIRKRSLPRRPIPTLARILYIDDGLDTVYQHVPEKHIVIHTATNYGRNGESRDEVFEANLQFASKLLSAAASHGCECFLNADTVDAQVQTPYFESKRAFREYARGFVQGGLKFLNVRIEQIYGPSDDSSKFATKVVTAFLRGQTHLELTKGEQSRDFIHVDDVVSAFDTLLGGRSCFDTGFHEIGVGTGVAVTVKEFVELAARLTGASTRLQWGAVPYRSQEIMESCADIRVLTSMGWRPCMALENGLRSMIESERKTA